MFEVEITPPSLLGIVDETFVFLCLPSMFQRISAAGFEGAVIH